MHLILQLIIGLERFITVIKAIVSDGNRKTIVLKDLFFLIISSINKLKKKKREGI